MGTAMNRHERRRKRLQILLKEVGKNADLAELVGTDPSYISQLKHGHRNIGDDIAERIEQATKRPDGWMDQWLPDEGGWAAAERNPDWHLFDRYRSIEDETTRKLIRDQILHASKHGARRPKRAAR